MPSVVTQADLLAHLREHCIEGVEDPFERIRSCMDGVREDLASAADDVGAYRSRTVASDVEDAAMLMGGAIGFALGYKIPAGEGHHWKAIRLLVLVLIIIKVSINIPVRRISSCADHQVARRYYRFYFGLHL